MQAEWFEIYNLIEWVLPRFNQARENYDQKRNPQDYLNYFLEREMSGYRAVNNNQIVQVTSQAEIAAIEEASARKTGFEGVSEHIQTALTLLGKKPEPDYRNSIKESICAVEAAAILVTQNKKASLEQALSVLEKNGALHGAFKRGVSALYGYTSDAEGIRHAMLEVNDVSFAEAKFMLVACSAFANFLIDSARK